MKKIMGIGIVFILLISAYRSMQTMEQDSVIAAEMQGIGLGTNSGTAFDTLSILPVLMASEEISNDDAEEVPNYYSDEAPSYVSEEEERFSAFGKVLWDAYLKGTLPDGYPLDYHDGVEGAAKNSFALADVDSDGRDELLLLWENAYMAGMVEYVFDYCNEEVYAELWEFPAMTFYDNGIVEVEWSHNQGLGGDFWPYSIYCYDAENDVYESFGGVDAWDKKVAEEDHDGEPFPMEIDADGDGLVYYIMPADYLGHWNTPLVDGPAYEAWRNAYLGGAEEIPITYRKLTEENIAALGCPKPDVPLPQPVG